MGRHTALYEPMIDLFRPDQRLKAARAAAGYRTAKEFADKNGFPAVTVQKHEKGKEAGGRGLRRAQAEKYARALAKTLDGVNADWLLYGRGEPPVGVLGPPGQSPARPAPARSGRSGARETDAGGRRYPGQFRQDRARAPDPILDAPELRNIDPRLLAEVIAATEDYLSEHGLTVPGRKKADLILALYVLALNDAEERVDIARHANVIQLAL